MHHHWQHSLLCACSCSISHRPDGKIADVLALTHACTTANSSVNYSRYMPQRPSKVPIFDGKGADVLALTHACKTTNASVNNSMYVPQRPSKIPIAPMGDSHFARCLQGGGVFVDGGGSVTFDSCNITGSTAQDVRARAQNFPLPRWETNILLVVCRAAVSLSTRAAQ